jgi:DsbC/DsbD-like thiol-disulfide interchange protein
MLRRSSLLCVLLLFLLCALCVESFFCFSLRAAQVPRATDVVKPEAFVSLAPVPRGRTVDLAVVAHIRSGFHMNSHQPKEDYLIPTALTADLPKGLRALSTIYPAGAMRKFKFSPDALSVYDGSVTIRMKLQVAATAPLGKLTLPLTLRYQPCNDELCLPPANLPLSIEIEIAPAGAKAQPQHPEIFSAPAGKKAPSKK